MSFEIVWAVRSMLRTLILVSYSAEIKNAEGMTAVDLAEEGGYNEIVELVANWKPPHRGKLYL